MLLSGCNLPEKSQCGHEHSASPHMPKPGKPWSICSLSPLLSSSWLRLSWMTCAALVQLWQAEQATVSLALLTACNCRASPPAHCWALPPKQDLHGVCEPQLVGCCAVTISLRQVGLLLLLSCHPCQSSVTSKELSLLHQATARQDASSVVVALVQPKSKKRRVDKNGRPKSSKGSVKTMSLVTKPGRE